MRKSIRRKLYSIISILPNLCIDTILTSGWGYNPCYERVLDSSLNGKLKVENGKFQRPLLSGEGRGEVSSRRASFNGKLKIENGKFLRNITPSPQQKRAGVRGPKEISNNALESIQCTPQTQTSPTLSSSDKVRRSSLLKPTKSLKNIESEPHVSDKKTVGVETPTYSTAEKTLRFEKAPLTTVTTSVTLTPQSLNHSHQLKSRVQFIAPTLKGGATC